MKRLKICSLVLVSCSALFAGSVRVWVFGMPGAATESDKQSAMSEAADRATENANGMCTGSVVNTSVTSNICFHTGNDDDGNWICTASAKAFCEIRTAH